jgi:hypothetical protein
LSPDEVLVLARVTDMGLTKKALRKIDLMPEFDDLDTWPISRRYRPAGQWGAIHTPGLRKASPFDGLLGELA